MPVISNRPTGIPGGATPGTVGGVQHTNPTQPATQGVDGGTVPSTGGQPVPVVINGFGGKPLPNVNITLVPSPGQLGGKETRADLEDGGWVSRGFIDVRYKPALGGVDVEVESRHTKPGDPASYKGDDMAIYLQARVLDQGKERVITLATMFEGIMNPEGTSAAVRKFHVDYDEVNRWLAEKAPGLQLHPGDPLAAFAVWKGSGHQWGGFMREGYFNSPEPLGKSNAVDVRTGPIKGAPAAVSVSDAAKPIDITHKVPDALVDQYPLVLEKGAKFVSRREHETKYCPRSLAELKQATLELLGTCASSPRDREKALLKMFGPDEALSKARGYPVSGWKISTTDRYYARDDAGTIVKGADGLPIVVPMFDVYQDDPNAKFPFAQQNMAVRFRDGEIAHGANVGSMGKLNMKTPRVADPFNLIQTGLELSLDTKPGISKNPAAMQQLAAYLDSAPAPYNPMLEQKKVSYSLRGSNVQQSAVDNLANRFKFTLEHETGLEIEVSMDFVHAGFVFEKKDVAATRAMSEAQKFDRYAQLLERPDSTVLCVSGPQKTQPGEINTVVFKDGADLVMANFWIDGTGARRASEHPAVQFPQVEMEMDHVQARSVGPVQQAYVKPTEVKNLTNDADQEAFLQTVSSHATMNGPPTTHAWEDLKDAKLYQDPSYLELGTAVTSFRHTLFPGGVNGARQKAAQALEIGGYVPKRTLTLGATLPWSQGRDINVNINWQQRNKIEVKAGNGYGQTGTGTMGGKPAVLSVDFDGFPVRIPLKGTETTREVAEAIQRTLDKAVLYKAVLHENPPQNQGGKPSYTIEVLDR